MRKHSLLLVFSAFYLPQVCVADFDRGLEALKKMDDRASYIEFREAAEQGHAKAQVYLAMGYDLGLGVPRNDTEAARWYRRAAEQGHAGAQSHLANMYNQGRGVSKNEAEAVRWYRRAAEQGNEYAQFNLARMYKEGRGTPKNIIRAYMWESLAAAQGHEQARHDLGISEQLMTREQVAEAQRLAAAFQPRAETPGPASANSEHPPSRPPVAPSATVRNIQRNLAKLGYEPGSVDGLVGPSTTRAIQAFQRDSGITPDGIVSTTLEALLAAIVKGGRHINQPEAKLASTGSGFLVNREGHVLTNLHVVDGCKAIRAALPSGGWNAKLVAFHKGDDLAVVHSDLKPPSFAVFRGSPAALGEDVAVAGYPLHGLLSGMNLTTGTVSATSGLGGDTRYVQIAAPVQGGNSGGPLLDSSGAVVGVIVSKLDVAAVARATGDVAQNVNFAIKSAAVRSFLSINDIAHEAVTTDATKDRTVVAAEAQQYTVLVECWK